MSILSLGIGLRSTALGVPKTIPFPVLGPKLTWPLGPETSAVWGRAGVEKNSRGLPDLTRSRHLREPRPAQKSLTLNVDAPTQGAVYLTVLFMGNRC